MKLKTHEIKSDKEFVEAVISLCKDLLDNGETPEQIDAKFATVGLLCMQELAETIEEVDPSKLEIWNLLDYGVILAEKGTERYEKLIESYLKELEGE
jgi:hypothetical protein